MLIAFFAGMLAFAAAGKLRHRARFAEIVKGYKLIPERFAPIAGLVVPIVEFGAAGLIILQPLTGAVLAAAIFLLYGALLLSAIIRRIDLEDCGCSWGPGSEKGAGWPLVARNVVLAAAVLTLSFAPATDPAGTIEILTGLGAAAVAVLFWLAVSTLAGNRSNMKAAGHV